MALVRTCNYESPRFGETFRKPEGAKRTPNYGHLLNERYHRACKARRAAVRAVNEMVGSPDHKLVWSHAYEVRMRVAENLMKRGGRPGWEVAR